MEEMPFTSHKGGHVGGSLRQTFDSFMLSTLFFLPWLSKRGHKAQTQMKNCSGECVCAKRRDAVKGKEFTWQHDAPA